MLAGTPRMAFRSALSSMLTAIIAVSGVGASASCAPTPSDRPGPFAASRAPQVLSQRELKALLSTDWRFRELPIVESGPAERLEFFWSDGRYQGCADRAVIDGRYEIRGNKLCTIAGPRLSCRRLLRDAKGAYSQQALGASGRLYAPRPVQVDVIPRGQSCFHQGPQK
jgi:hypothetical protein